MKLLQHLDKAAQVQLCGELRKPVVLHQVDRLAHNAVKIAQQGSRLFFAAQQHYLDSPLEGAAKLPGVGKQFKTHALKFAPGGFGQNKNQGRCLHLLRRIWGI